MSRNFRIGIYQDKLGITPAYNTIWNEILLKAGLLSPHYTFIRFRAYDHFPQADLIQWKGNRKSPGFIEDPGKQVKTLNWVKKTAQTHRLDFLVFMDPALFFIVNQKWDQATSETLRGGTYHLRLLDDRLTTILVTIPVSSVNRQMKPKDIAALNNGFSDYESWREVFKPDPDDSDESEDDDTDELSEVHQIEWYAPMVVPYGRFCLQSDMNKLGRLIQAKEEALQYAIRRIDSPA